jgi:LPS O-antigen subunit length determinant protein (WzzB/FepE family)
MPSYTLTKMPNGMVLIEEDNVQYHATEATLLEDIEHLKASRPAYTNAEYFEHTLKMLEEALALARSNSVEMVKEDESVK